MPSRFWERSRRSSCPSYVITGGKPPSVIIDVYLTPAGEGVGVSVVVAQTFLPVSKPNFACSIIEIYQICTPLGVCSRLFHLGFNFCTFGIQLKNRSKPKICSFYYSSGTSRWIFQCSQNVADILPLPKSVCFSSIFSRNLPELREIPDNCWKSVYFAEIELKISRNSENVRRS